MNAKPWACLLTLTIALLSGCGSSDERPDAPAAGGTGGTAGAPAVVPQVCKDACVTVLDCNAEADIPACEAQCSLEVSGQGYLIQHVAEKYFDLVANAETERGINSKCLYLSGLTWWHWKDHPKEINALPEQDVMLECRQHLDACVTPIDDGWRWTCFRDHYRYNTDTRAKVRECFSAPCAMGEPFKCMKANRPEGSPWLVGFDEYEVE